MTKREKVWLAYAELCADTLGDDEMREPTMDRDTYSEIAKRYKARWGESLGASKAEVYMLREDPWIDSVAVERALNFDWPVFHSLTRDEREVVYRRLAECEDPYEEGVDTLLEYVRGKQVGTGSSTERTPKDLGRRLNWLSGSKQERRQVSQGMGRYARQAQAA